MLHVQFPLSLCLSYANGERKKCEEEEEEEEAGEEEEEKP